MPGGRNVKKTRRSKSITAGALLNTAVTCKVYIAIRGDTETRKRGDAEIRRHGDTGTGRRGTERHGKGDGAKGGRGDAETRGPGERETGDGRREIRRHGNAGKTSPVSPSPPLRVRLRPPSPCLRVRLRLLFSSSSVRSSCRKLALLYPA